MMQGVIDETLALTDTPDAVRTNGTLTLGPLNVQIPEARTQGAKPEDREVVTEITLTPSISGKTSVDSVGKQSLGVEWKRDY